jgi:SAM-dependent methyltransferase
MMKKFLRKVVAGPFKLSMLGMQRGPHIWRYYMYRHLAELFRGIGVDKEASVLAISGSKTLCELLGFPDTRITIADYPAYDIMNLSFGDETFDFIVSDQVLEHLDGNPQKAIDESLRILKPGGIAVHTTCFIQQIHWGPKDLWRFSPDALRFLARDFSEIIDCSGWGNRFIWPYIWLGLRFEGIPEATWHPIHKLATYNEKAWPAVTWVVARK